MKGMDFAVHLGFPHPSGDQLGVLGPVVEDQNASLKILHLHRAYGSFQELSSPKL